MKQLKGPALFLAQFASDEAPFNSFETIVEWAALIGYVGVQIPSWDGRIFDLERAAEDQDYCDGLIATAAKYGVQLTELSTHLQGQLVACHPAYDTLFNGFCPEFAHDDPKAKQKWGTEQLMWAAKASGRLGMTEHATFPGALLWHTMYPWPQRPAGLVEQAFAELASRWLPILDAFDKEGVDVCYEIHPGEDLHDGVTFERFLEAVDNHPRCNILYDPSHLILQGMDYLEFIDIYHERIKMFHVKDGELNCNGRSGVYGGYQAWIDRPGRFRSLGDGQIDFNSIFSKLTQYGFEGWSVVEWECCIKDPEDGAREGAQFVREHTIKPCERSFDDFAGSGADEELNKKVLGI